ISPMLATLGTTSDLDPDDDWAFEMKWDGIRIVAYLGAAAADIRLVTRNGNDVTTSYPEIAESLRDAVGPGELVLDGEIVALDRRHRPDFGLLQTRMGLTRPADVEKAARTAPVQYLVFDVLQVGGASLTAEAYDERRRRLIDL